MTSPAKKLYDEALALPEPERRRLAEALLETVPLDSAEELESAWREEVMRRVDEVRAGDVELETWSEIRRHVREALKP